MIFISANIKIREMVLFVIQSKIHLYIHIHIHIHMSKSEFNELSVKKTHFMTAISGSRACCN